jgi:hypothetical protein
MLATAQEQCQTDRNAKIKFFQGKSFSIRFSVTGALFDILNRASGD